MPCSQIPGRSMIEIVAADPNHRGSLRCESSELRFRRSGVDQDELESASALLLEDPRDDLMQQLPAAAGRDHDRDFDVARQFLSVVETDDRIVRLRMINFDPTAAMNRPFGDMRSFLEYVAALGFDPRFIVDVGAHRGDWASIALDCFPSAGMLMIEPQPELRSALHAFCSERRNARWVEAAAGSRREERYQTIWPDLQGSSFLPRPDPTRIASGEQRLAPVRTLDELLAEDGRGVPDLVKVDVQGFELQVLKGSTSILGRTELIILETSLFEFLDDIPILREVIDFMAINGYEIYDIAGVIRRPVDAALGQLDVAFALRRGFLRSHDRW